MQNMFLFKSLIALQYILDFDVMGFKLQFEVKSKWNVVYKKVSSFVSLSSTFVPQIK